MLVLKFGGASLSNAMGFYQIRSWLDSISEPVVLVVSALYGITDQLEDLMDLAVQQKTSDLLEGIQDMRHRYNEVIRDLQMQKTEAEALVAEVMIELEELESMLESCAVLQEVSPRARDRMLASGERLSSALSTHFLNASGTLASRVRGEDVIVTDEDFSRAVPYREETRSRITEVLNPMLQEGRIPVVAGFTGRNRAHQTTTLGRGGTDYTATLLAEALHAREVWFLKETTGVLSTDPRRVPGARLLSRLSFREMAELSWFGAKVLHPIAMQPLIEGAIEARIRSFAEMENEGTFITLQQEVHCAPIKAITSIENAAVVTLCGLGMAGFPGMAARLFQALARKNINVLMISQSSSEQNICLVLAQEEARPARQALETEFAPEIRAGRIEGVQIQHPMAILALVGAGMRGIPGVAGRIFGVLGEAGVNVYLIAQGSSEYNISFVVDQESVATALKHLHQSLCEENPQ